MSVRNTNLARDASRLTVTFRFYQPETRWHVRWNMQIGKIHRRAFRRLSVTVAPVCKHVVNSSAWKYQNATPPPLNVPEEIHGALKHETISLVCEVEASPTTVTFHWTFNSSGDLTDIPSTKYTNEGTSSRLNYTPSSDMDYGTLGCWASNTVGSSKQPCIYQVIAAGSLKFSPTINTVSKLFYSLFFRISFRSGFFAKISKT